MTSLEGGQFAERAAVQVRLAAEDRGWHWCRHQADSPWILARDAQQRLQLQDVRQPRQRPLCLDLAGAEIQRRIAQGRKSLLARALGCKSLPWTIVDLTAGLGRDAATCAGLGMQVVAFERQPLLMALLEDAWLRAPTTLQARIQLRFGMAQPADWAAADAVLYDPMYPQAGAGAAPALELQQLRALVGIDTDVAPMFAGLRADPPARLALKRPPRGVSVQLEKPDFELRGARVHWSVYLRPPRPAASDG